MNALSRAAWPRCRSPSGCNVAANAVTPSDAFGVELGGVGDGVAAGAQAVVLCVEAFEVKAGQAGHGAAEVNPFHGESLPGDARSVELGGMLKLRASRFKSTVP